MHALHTPHLRLVAQGGPVTAAIHAATVEHSVDLDALRRRLADRIERDLALLDALDGDVDLELEADREDCAREWSGSGMQVLA